MSGAIDPQALRRTACELVRLGGETAGRLLGRVAVEHKADQSPVTAADHAAQETILHRLAGLFPDHAVISEETIAQPQRHAAVSASEYCWIVDPIDGTRNFARGVPVYACAVAVLRTARPLAAAIFDASSRQITSACAGAGAFRDEQPIRHRSRPADQDKIVAVGSFRRKPPPDTVRRWLDRYTVRNFGSVSLHLAWLAGGRLDAAFSCECKLWDIAAGALIAVEAGCLATDLEGRSPWPVDLERYNGEDSPLLAAGPAVHPELLASLKSP